MEDGQDIVLNQMNECGEWVNCSENGEAAVREIIQNHFIYTTDLWEDCVGADSYMEAVVTVHSPQSIAGVYCVDLHKVIQASVRKKS
jgi:hypothetical protein